MRDDKGRFKKGQSGNPKGKPKSESAELRQAMQTQGQAVVDIVIAKALEGDLAACKLVLERLVPPLKPTAKAALDFPLDASEREQRQSVIKALASGQIGAEVAAVWLSLLQSEPQALALVPSEIRRVIIRPVKQGACTLEDDDAEE